MHSLLSTSHHHMLSHPDQPNRVRGKLNAVLGLLRVPITKACHHETMFLLHCTDADHNTFTFIIIQVQVFAHKHHWPGLFAHVPAQYIDVPIATGYNDSELHIKLPSYIHKCRDTGKGHLQTRRSFLNSTGKIH